MTTAFSVPVCGGVLALLQTIQASKALFIGEASLASWTGEPHPGHWYTRCEALLAGYKQSLAKLNLTADKATLDAILGAETTDEMRLTFRDDNSVNFVFTQDGVRKAPKSVVAHTVTSTPSPKDLEGSNSRPTGGGAQSFQIPMASHFIEAL